MSLEQYQIRSERTRFLDHLGTEEWTLVFEVPTENIADERANLQASTTNILRGHDATDIYAPCIHDSVVNIDPDNPEGKIVTCVYRRPTDEMILQPGRGLIEFDSFSTTESRTVLGMVEKQPDFRGGLFRSLAPPLYGYPNFFLRDTYFDTIEQTLHEIVERGVIILRLCDWAINEGPVFERAERWIGKGDEPQVRASEERKRLRDARHSSISIADGLGDWANEVSFGIPALTINKTNYYRLKCSKVEIRRRPHNVAITDSRFYFTTKDTKWELGGTFKEKWYLMDAQGQPIPYDPDEGIFANTRVYKSLRLLDYEKDVVNGYADFTPVQSYFTWMGGS